MSAAFRRPGLIVGVLGLTAALSLAASRADARPETFVGQSDRVAEVIALAEQVAERQESLHALNQQADARDRLLIGYRAVLQTYGYTGDPDLAELVLPLASYDVSAGFGLTGPLWEAEHGGQDFGASTGEPIVAVADGVITEVADSGPYGLRTILTLADGTEIWYCHQTSVSVAAGYTVEMTEEIGTVGSTGNSTGPHLHLEVRPAARNHSIGSTGSPPSGLDP